jgi:hypothetical protein
MALTITLDARPFDNISTHRVVFGTITFDSSYPTGGEALTGSDLKNLGSEIEKILFEPASNTTPIIKHLKYDYVNRKVLAFDVAGTQTADATDLSAYSAGFVAFGK